MPDSKRLVREHCMILVIDVQEKLLPLIDGQAAVVDATKVLVRGASIFDVPLLVSEQYPKGIGHTDASLVDILRAGGATVFEKLSFSCCADPKIQDMLQSIDHRQVIIAGIEAHVCVLQTSLDLLAQGFEVFVCADAVGSRSATDYHNALQRLRAAGVIVTTVESVLFELCQQCDTPQFKRMIDVIKQPRAEDHRF